MSDICMTKARFPLANFFARSDFFRRRNISPERQFDFHTRNRADDNYMARNMKSQKQNGGTKQ